MQHRRLVITLSLLTALVGAFAAGVGVFYRSGPGPREYETIRGDTVTTYGRGLYRHMSAEVAPQGIAQDVVTLLVAVPLLLIASGMAQRGSFRARFVLAGTLAYFVVTYLFYLMMAMYNPLFLAYVVVLSVSVFALALVLAQFEVATLPHRFAVTAPIRGVGVFLIVNALLIGMLWLSIVLPPLFSGAVVPREVEHYTTLVVQGLDLALLLPLSVLAGWLFLKRRPFGYLLAPIYIVFLSLLMVALAAKIVAMGILGYSVVPAVVIIPGLMILGIVLATLTLRSVLPQGH